jgi:hypothetical protein
MLSKTSYYHTLGSLIDSLDLLIALISVQELQLVSGVCRMCWGPYLALTEGVGFVAVGTRHGVPSDTRMLLLGTLHSSFGTIVETSAGLPCGVDSNRR